MTALSPEAGRQCLGLLNSLHSTVYFSVDLDKELAQFGVDDPAAVYLAGRSAALGPVGPGTVTAAFYGFAYAHMARHLPGLWERVSPAEALAARLRAADSTLRRVLGEDVADRPETREAATLALRATEACIRPGRPLYAAHADLPVPQEAHLALWHATTLLREHRGDGHLAVLAGVELFGLDALVSHSASRDGMPKEVVREKRGWSEEEWSAAERRLCDRGLMTDDGKLTTAGAELREHVENETDRLDRAPYEHLGADAVGRLTELSGQMTMTAAMAGAFPAELLAIFANR